MLSWQNWIQNISLYSYIWMKMDIELIRTSVQFSSVAQSCLTLCDPMNCSITCFPVFHCLPEFAETHVHQVSDAIQPYHSSSPPSPLALNISQYQGLFQWVGSYIRRQNIGSFSFSISPSSEYSGSISFRIDWFDLLAIQGTLKSPPVPQFESINPAPQFKIINSSALSLLYGPTLTFIHDYF